MIVDTDVLIWYMKGNQKARRAIDSLESYSISAVNYMELVQGIRNRDELMALRGFINQKKITILHMSNEISQKAIYYLEQFSLSHHLRMADALIAATAFVTKATLLTANTKHYRAIREINAKSFRP